MFHLLWFRTRGKPGLPGGQGRRLALLGFLVAASLLETGCQSDPCSPCGFIGRTTSFVMRPFRHGCNGCPGSPVVAEAACVPSGVAVGVTAAPMVAPVPQAGPIAPGAGLPSNVPAPETPQYLEQAPHEQPPQASPGQAPVRGSPPSTGGTNTGGTGSTGSGRLSPMSYETYRPDPRSNSSRGDNLAHTLITTPVPAARSARESSRVMARDKPAPLDGDGNSNSESVLDHLPPLDLPSEVTEKTKIPQVAPAAQRKPQSPASTTPPVQAPASGPLSGRSPGKPDLALAGTAMPVSEPASSAGGVRGISRFVAVDLKLAAGSVPSPAGLDWLTDKGYKTLVDLRESSEIDLPFIAEAARRGLRYIALPVSLKSIDRAHVARFNFELAMGEARPLYFFDSDGTRAGTLWYIRRIAVDRVNTEIARREAEDLGLKSPDYWSAARSYLERLDNLRSQALDATGPVSAVNPQETEGQASGAVRSQTLPERAAVASAPSPAPSTAAPAARETTAWRRYATIVITGLTLPLAYWSRSAIPTILARTLASLPAPARRLKSLPRELDA